MRLLNFLLLTCLVAVACASRVGSVGSSLGVPTANTKKKNFHGVVHKFDATPSFVANNVKGATPAAPAPVQLPAAMKLLIGVGGIYASFLYYGTLQEDVFSFRAKDGSKFKAAWFLQAMEALANVVVGGIGMQLTGATKGLPLKMFALAGTSQVFAKAFTSLALASGLSFPVATLAKSGKMVPVMIGTLLLGGATYTLREYASVAAIIAGTAIVSGGGGKKSQTSSPLGLAFILLSLTCDGITGGMQGRLKKASADLNVKAKPYDFMFWTNFFMAIVATVIAVVLGEAQSGFDFCANNPVILKKILNYSLCSAVGQSFIFYTITNFNPLVCTTVTTTRKVFSVLLSIFLKGHSMSPVGWSGLALASAGILSELQDKGSHKPVKTSDAKKK